MASDIHRVGGKSNLRIILVCLIARAENQRAELGNKKSRSICFVRTVMVGFFILVRRLLYQFGNIRVNSWVADCLKPKRCRLSLDIMITSHYSDQLKTKQIIIAPLTCTLLKFVRLILPSPAIFKLPRCAALGNGARPKPLTDLKRSSVEPCPQCCLAPPVSPPSL